MIQTLACKLSKPIASISLSVIGTIIIPAVEIFHVIKIQIFWIAKRLRNASGIQTVIDATINLIAPVIK